MSYPRRVIPGMTVMITRRTLRRTHLLRPDPELNNLFRYCLAVVAETHGVLVHAAVVMSTHEHLIVTDVRGELPFFLQELHRLLALGVKVLRKWEGSVWDNQKTSVVELCTHEAVLEKIAYAIANPVAAGLVRRARDWRGVMTAAEELGCASWTAERPTFYLDQDNPRWPPVATLALHMPRLDVSDRVARTTVARQVADLEASARATLKAAGRQVVGPERLTRSSPYERAKSWEPVRGRSPCFAVGSGQREVFFERAAVLQTFRSAYRAALDAWRRGFRSAVFPTGTWLMHWTHGALVAVPQ
jgi:putative transposase